ncbi:hypothetical protein HPB47_000762 [Ixodes persulcatus]|uniref:Uncharacterized protein n=1 Tax=Ixodes persulcatus TaxID=34615 RepID=A0AC60PR59_IXOPE|nr:hypothetical protein HPB47_000762 [Ixodes persulcatus]
MKRPDCLRHTLEASAGCRSDTFRGVRRGRPTPIRTLTRRSCPIDGLRFPEKWLFDALCYRLLGLQICDRAPYMAASSNCQALRPLRSACLTGGQAFAAAARWCGSEESVRGGERGPAVVDPRERLTQLRCAARPPSVRHRPVPAGPPLPRAAPSSAFLARSARRLSPLPFATCTTEGIAVGPS